jgi:uncharacterized protein (TIGR02646 family)
MILINRSSVEPPFTNSTVLKKMNQGLKEYYKRPQNSRRQNKPPYIPIPPSVLEKIRIYLLKEFSGKCAYCETLITLTYPGDFDHFRPKSAARGLGQEFSLDHYWTLAFDWRNMYLCCEVCNRYKVNWFPVEGKRSSLSQTFNQILKHEKNLLIDPCHEDPSLHINYRENGMVKAITRKGEITIDTLKLNRKDLVERRREKYSQLLTTASVLINKRSKIAKLSRHEVNTVSSLAEWLDDLYSTKPKEEHAGMQRFFFEQIIRKNTELAQFLLHNDVRSTFKKQLKRIGIERKAAQQQVSSLTKTTTKPILQRFTIESIEIQNFKSIEKLVIHFPRSQNRKEPWLMLLGENGVGKSSFLQAVSLTLMGETYRKKLEIKPSEFLRNGCERGFVKIIQPDQPAIELHFTKNAFEHSIKTSPTYLLGYGSTRLFPTKKIKPEKTLGKIRAKNIFTPDVALYADNWLVSLYGKNRKQFDFAARALKAMLAKELEDPGIEFKVTKDEVWLHYSNVRNKPDKLRSLSDGYKSIIALACDMMQALMQGNTKMEVAEGIVLLDEIGTHLHPRWKMRVVNSFRAAFPRLQFIVTTHDPLCLKGLFDGEIAVFDKNEAGQVFAIANLPDPGEYRADQLLSSRFFGLNSTIDEETEKEFNEYYALLGREDKLSAKDKKKLNQLKENLKDKKHLGNSLREELAFNAVDTLLSKEKQQEQTTPVKELKQKTISYLQALWDKPIEEQMQIVS